MITQAIDLNMIPSSAPVVVHVDQYDHGDGRFVISLYNGDTPYTPTGTAIIQGTKPDGKGFEYSATLSGNTVTANLTEQMTAVFGIVRAQIVITETSGRTGTFVFNLDVQKSALPADADMSHSEYQIVEELLEDVQQAAADAAQSAESADASAEDSEAWAVGTRDGVPVTSDDPTYHNNSKWWAEHGGGGGGSAHTIVNAKGQDMTNRAALKFANMKVTDDAVHNQTVVESGSIITITTTESTLYGQNVTLSDGTTTLTETFSNSGVAVFYGVSLTGNLSISSSDGTDTAIGSLTVPYFGIFEKDISFWSATIAVSTTTSDFDGLTVYAKKNGVTKGSAVFSSGSANITVPETGSYILEVTQDWHTYTSQAVTVSAQTTYNASIDGFKAPISLSTPTTDFYSQSIAVSLDGSPITTSLAFDNTGAASFDALVAGTYVFTLTYQGEPYTATVVVTTETSYSGVIKMWTATIKVTASSQLYSQSVTVYKGSTSVGTVTLDATGKADILVHEAGTYYVKGVYDGWTYSTDAISVSAETDYPVTLDVFICTLSISTTSTELYSQAITVTKGGSTVGTTAFSAGGSATFRVHETGTYTLTCTYSGDDYSSDITIVSGDNGQTKTISIETGLKLADWLTEAGLDPSDYADFAAVEGDEAAVRRLMTIHDAVDYLATASAGDQLMEDVINSNICAKWINLRDYALDTLYANSDIASEMDTADKYFYGEWCIIDDTTTPVTWGAKGNVPIMTSVSTPYGTAWNEGTTTISGSEAWKAFDGDDSTQTESGGSGGTAWAVTYLFAAPVCVKKIKIKTRTQYSSSNVNILQGSYDGSTWDPLKELTELQAADTEYEIPINNSNYYAQYRIYCASSGWNGFKTIQYYGRELSGIIPAMTSNNTPYGVASIDYTPYENTPAYYAFDKKPDTLLHGPTSADYCHVTYEFPSARVIKYVKIDFRNRGTSLVIKGSNAGGTWDPLFSASTPAITSNSGHTVWLAYLNNSTAYKYYYVESTGGSTTATPEFWEVDMFDFDYSERDWNSVNPKHYIYDHGVMPNGALTDYEAVSTSIAEDNGNELYVSMTGSNNFAAFYKSEDLSGFNLMRAVVGDKMGSSDSYGTSLSIASGITDASEAYVEKSTSVVDPYSDYTIDISSFSVTKYVRFSVSGSMQSAGQSRYGSIKEWWLE